MSGSGPTDYDEFFAETRPKLVGLALTGDLQVAQELAQGALTRAWIHWRRISSYDQPSVWARRVVRNLAADRAKHLRRTSEPPPPANVPAPTPDRLALIAALARRAARLRLAPFASGRRRYRQPRSAVGRVATVLVVAALLVAVFLAPWPQLHLFDWA
jgi:DNA-directed RNA polymerase specialized sigma24 family protein